MSLLARRTMTKHMSRPNAHKALNRIEAELLAVVDAAKDPPDSAVYKRWLQAQVQGLMRNVRRLYLD